MSGQAYRISLELEMPESPVNEQLGMFMVKMACYTKDGTVMTSVARSVSEVMLRFFMDNKSRSHASRFH